MGGEVELLDPISIPVICVWGHYFWKWLKIAIEPDIKSINVI